MPRILYCIVSAFNIYYADAVNVNVGGPVWSLAWCPVNGSHTTTQYLSLYTHHHAEDSHVFQQPSHDTAVIQLYDCGVLSSRHDSYALHLLHTFSTLPLCIPVMAIFQMNLS